MKGVSADPLRNERLQATIRATLDPVRAKLAEMAPELVSTEAVEALNRRIAETLGPLGAGRRGGMEKQLRLLTSPAAEKALELHREATIQPPWEQQIVQPVVRAADLHEPPDFKPVGPSRMQQAATWAQVLSLPVSIFGVVAAVVAIVVTT